MRSKPTIIFMGTPEFARPSLERLIQADYPIPLVVTQPNRPSGRGQKLTPPVVKQLALQNNISVFQPESFRHDPAAIERLKKIPHDFLVVAAFGQILPPEVLNLPRVAPLNVHASLLPAYRGAAPIARAIIEGEQETGVSIQWMVEALDMGDILYQIPCRIEESDTSGSLHDRLSQMGAQALIHCLELFRQNKIHRKQQDARVGSYALKLRKEERQIDFHQPAVQLHRRIMGLNPWPMAECQWMGQRLRIIRANFVPRPSDAEPGTIVDVTPDQIVVACLDGCIGLLELQMENKNRLLTSEFLKAQPLRTGMILGGHRT